MLRSVWTTCRSGLTRAWLRNAALCAAALWSAAPTFAGGCADIALVGNKSWWTIPVARSTCDGRWSVENHEKWLGTGGAGNFDAAATTASFVVSGDFDGDGYADLAALGGALFFAFSRGDGSFHYNDALNGAAWSWDRYYFEYWAQQTGVHALVGNFSSDPGKEIALVGGPGWASIPILRNIRRDSLPTVVNSTGQYSDSATMSDFGSWASAYYGAEPFAMDLNQDGYDDIVLVGGKDPQWGAWGSLPVAFSNGDGTFTPYNIFAFDGFEFLGTGWSVGYFAYWATQPGVKRIPGVFTNGVAGIALVGGKDGFTPWSSILVAAGFFSTPVSPYDGFRVANDYVGDYGSWATQARFKLAGDFDGDGQTDIALVGGPSGGLIGVNSPPWGSIPIAFSRGWLPWSVTNVGTVSLAYGWSTGEFVGWALQPNVKALAGDFNGDGKADIALVGGLGWSSIPVALSYGDGGFVVRNDTTTGTSTGWGTSYYGIWAEVAAKPVAAELISTSGSLGVLELSAFSDPPPDWTQPTCNSCGDCPYMPACDAADARGGTMGVGEGNRWMHSCASCRATCGHKATKAERDFCVIDTCTMCP